MANIVVYIPNLKGLSHEREGVCCYIHSYLKAHFKSNNHRGKNVILLKGVSHEF